MYSMQIIMENLNTTYKCMHAFSFGFLLIQIYLIESIFAYNSIAMDLMCRYMNSEPLVGVLLVLLCTVHLALYTNYCYLHYCYCSRRHRRRTAVNALQSDHNAILHANSLWINCIN